MRITLERARRCVLNVSHVAVRRLEWERIVRGLKLRKAHKSTIECWGVIELCVCVCDWLVRISQTFPELSIDR